MGDQNGNVFFFEFNGSQFTQAIQHYRQSNSLFVVGSDEEPKRVVCIQSPDRPFSYEHNEGVFQYRGQLITSGMITGVPYSAFMSSGGDYYFIVDSPNGVHAFRFNGSIFTHFQTIAAADSPWVVALNPNKTYAVVGCLASIILYSFDGLTFTKLNEIAESHNFLKIVFDGDTIFGINSNDEIFTYTIQNSTLVKIQTFTLNSQPLNLFSRDGPTGEKIIIVFFSSSTVYYKY